ncbi:MAG: L-threonylcarbamoyladenylate synthase [Tissierellia bacterium]|nr:L-threonylcarbamoyladenylate synthase [Tissierellia bacterium]
MIHILSTKEEHLKEAGDYIKKGVPVIFPTETVYGIGADGLWADSILRIFRAKGRPSDNPLILHIAEKDALRELGEEIPPYVDLLTDHFWPGPLSIVVKSSDKVPEVVRAGLSTVAIRMPKNGVARKIISHGGGVVAAPSANVSGRPSPTSFEDALQDAQYMEAEHGIGELAIVDGGQTKVGIESTVLLCTSYPPVILRPGKYTAEDIARLVGKCDVYHPKTSEERPQSPGMKYGHYMASKPTVLMDMAPEDTDQFLKKHGRESLRILFLATTENQWEGAFYRKNLSSYEEPEVAAEAYFKALREMDRQEGDLIVIQSCSRSGIGEALYERMKKSARGQVMKEDWDENWIW